MIVNNEELLPLNAPAKDAPRPSKKEIDEADGFQARVSEAFDSVELLLIARAEAEQAEAAAKARPETPLPFVKEDKKKAAAGEEKPSPARGISGQGGYTVATSANDEDSPAAMNMGEGLGRLSDATAVETTSLKDFLKPGGTLEADTFNKPGTTTFLRERSRSNDGLLGGAAQEDAAVATESLADAHIDELLRQTVLSGGSDLHLTVGLPPMVRKDGRLVPLNYETARERDSQRIVFDILTNEQMEKFERTHELDFSYGVKGIGRFRFNVYRQRGSVGCAMRVIPNKVPSMEQLKLPAVIREMTRKHSGLVLVTGPTGSGKSTTIASMIDIINSERECHILTIEDPIEYLHQHKKAMVNQRELGTDTDSFNNSLRAALREDPDVVLVGEMRDLETIAAAITLAETGHLVFATLHTRSAPATIDRIVDVFPAHQQEQIRIQLSTSIEAVVAQQLIPKMGGGRVAAIEIMVATSALRNLIREGKSYQIYSVIETGQQFGMQAMDKVLADLHRSGQISHEEAITRAIDRENFTRLLKGY